MSIPGDAPYDGDGEGVDGDGNDRVEAPPTAPAADDGDGEGVHVDGDAAEAPPNTPADDDFADNASDRSGRSEASMQRQLRAEKVRRRNRILLFLLLAAIIIFVIVDSLTSKYVARALSALYEWVDSHPLPGAFVLTLVVFLATLAFIPGALLTIGCGVVYGMIGGLGRGTAIGSAVVFVGAAVGSEASFVVGRYLLRDCVGRWVERYRIFHAVDKAMEKNGFRIFFLLRLSPIIPFNALNYMAGATAVTLRDYTLALIGLLPGTVLYVFVGASAGSAMGMGKDGDDSVSRGARIASIVAGVVLGVLGVIAVSYYAKKELNRIVAEQEMEKQREESLEEQVALVEELPTILIDTAESPIRLFRLTLGDITVELSSLGASITKVLLPDYSQSSSSGNGDFVRDDVVLSYASPKEQFEDGNRPFFGAIVGRVANRIKGGVFQLSQTDGDGSGSAVETYYLERNNGPNHLHGGSDGFCRRIWTADIVGDAIQFTLTSPDGDQGYPAGVRVTATYFLARIESQGVKLRLDMRASLLPGETKATPLALAQHSYLNLASHSSPCRILGHTLQLPNCARYTPLDKTSIPTREVRRVDGEGEAAAMDFRKETVLADALMHYGIEKAGLESNDARNNVQQILAGDASNDERVARTPTSGGAPAANLDGDAPYGFDHNYAIEGSSSTEEGMRVAAILSHPSTGRCIRVSTTAPGMQLYTANYLDGSSPPPALCKDGARYDQWQGICLETQTYPDSIYPDDATVYGEEEFATGKCFILRPGGEDYFHAVEYEFLQMREEG
ncbi:hypothetical protein ACHAXT_008060 [Thalassiosira profunda]